MEVTLLEPLSTTGATIPGLILKPKWYSHRAIGGPYQAELAGEGEEYALFSAISALGYGLNIYSDFTDKVWWGQIYEVKLIIGAVTVAASLDNLRNKVKVLYTTKDPDTGELSGQIETDWEYDTESVLRYGLREFIYSVDGITETEAITYRHNLLLAMKDPKPVITTSNKKGKSETSLTVRCRGWFDALDYRYYTVPYSEESYLETGYGWQQFGKSTTYQKAAMSFQAAAGSYKNITVSLQVSATAPTDNVTCKLYSDSSGPNTLLGTADNSIAASTLKNQIWTECKFTFAAAVALSASTTYWIVLERSGSLSDLNYYAVDGNNDCTYADGAAKIYNGAAWADPATAIDLQFRIWTDDIAADADSTALIKSMVEGVSTGVEINTVEIITTSGVNTCSSIDGKSTIKCEIVKMLETGSSNYRRMLARVLSNKRLEIYEEPAATSSGWIDRDGVLHDLYGGLMRADTCPVAMWISLKGVIPIGVAFGQVSPETCFFVEECEYKVDTGAVTVKPKREAGETNFMAVGNG